MLISSGCSKEQGVEELPVADVNTDLTLDKDREWRLSKSQKLLAENQNTVCKFFDVHIKPQTKDKKVIKISPHVIQVHINELNGRWIPIMVNENWNQFNFINRFYGSRYDYSVESKVLEYRMFLRSISNFYDDLCVNTSNVKGFKCLVQLKYKFTKALKESTESVQNVQGHSKGEFTGVKRGENAFFNLSVLVNKKSLPIGNCIEVYPDEY